MFDPRGLSLNSLRLAERIGRGSSRDVYTLQDHPTLVLKLVRQPGDFSNISEWTVWDRMRECVFVTNWLAPCVSISYDGLALIQYRTTPVIREELLRKIPNWMTDLRVSNWGRLMTQPGQKYPNRLYPVCHDYASHLMLEKGATRRLMKAKWRTDVQ